MEDEEHPVIALLKARKASHPEEFAEPWGRWRYALDQLAWYMTDAEKRDLLTSQRKATFDNVHIHALEELLKGANNE